MREKTFRCLVLLVTLFSYCLQGEAGEAHDLATPIGKFSTGGCVSSHCQPKPNGKILAV